MESVVKLTSPSFRAGAPIPKRHAKEGDDLSPPLAWSDVPDGTHEFALICDDPDAPRAEPWVHWVLFKIPPTRTSLDEGDRSAGTAGKNDFGDVGWGGPQPPKGHGVHHYHFRLYALGAPVELSAGITKGALLSAMKGNVLAEAELVGTYEKK
jgi:Raf kinase inhibitor-like YbhB/YbcL family protein